MRALMFRSSDLKYSEATISMVSSRRDSECARVLAPRFTDEGHGPPGIADTFPKCVVSFLLATFPAYIVTDRPNRYSLDTHHAVESNPTSHVYDASVHRDATFSTKNSCTGPQVTRQGPEKWRTLSRRAHLTTLPRKSGNMRPS